jgi:FkbM family methyltransferase
MISYAQNAEDVVLARALGPGPGFYVDVGAAGPDIASVTRHFYEAGWHGINIDPRPDAIAELNERRPRDINLCLAVGAENGVVPFHLNRSDADLSTTVAEYGDGWDAASRDTVLVEQRRLDDILAEHARIPIDFLKVDVEGAEADVLSGTDLSVWRPRVIVVEAVRPYSRIRTDGSWRAIVEAHGYREGGFDGVNLFFASPDEPGLLADLAPASVLDDYRPAWLVLITEDLERTRTYARQLEADRQKHLDTQRDLARELDGLRRRLRSVERRSRVVDLAERARRPAQASVGAAAPTSADPVASAAPTRVAKPCRIAVIGTPMSGNTWIATVLAAALDAAPMEGDHPGEVPWDSLPERCVVQLHWPRTAYLEAVLAEAGFTVLSPARRTADVLVALSPAPDQFERFALSEDAADLLSITPTWWTSPSVVRIRVEDCLSAPAAAFSAALVDLEQRCARSLAEVLADPGLDRVRNDSLGLPDASALGQSGASIDVAAARRVHDVHHGVIAALGYDSIG